jgi:leucyl aminopeptidase
MSPTIAATSAAPTTLSLDALVIAVAPAGGRRKGVRLAPGVTGFTPAIVRRLEAALDAVGAAGSAGEVTKIPGAGLTRCPLIVAAGLGDRPDTESVRRSAGAAARALAGVRRAGFAFGSCDVEAVALGAGLGAYAFSDFKGTGTPKPSVALRSISVVVPDAKSADVKAALARAAIVVDEVHRARDWINTPPSALPPETLAEAALLAVDGLPITTEVWDEQALSDGGYGGILAVGQGSVNPPRMVRLTYAPKQPVAHLAFVGKGITFDTGGISLKPPQAMETMKCDMSGAAAVIAATAAIARLGLLVAITTWAPMAENMPSGTAQRPSDVITMYGGRTVEVLNTDAEGRLILGDALARAAEDRPDLIVDVATLTGAQTIALGHRTAGVMGNNDGARDEVVAAAAAAGELMWPMPLPDELRPSIDSPVADLANIGERNGGMMTGAVFLREFVPAEIPWVHIDIAGPAFNTAGPYGYLGKGGTGFAVRTLTQLALARATGR